MNFDVCNIPLTGTQLIEASAGTGKTYSITNLYLRLLLERSLQVKQILVVTFTEKATAELNDRIRARLRTALQTFEQNNAADDPVLNTLLANSKDKASDSRLLQRALLDMDEAAISTIHGFCHRMLQQGAFESGTLFDMELVKDTSTLLQEIIEDYIANTSHNLPPLLADLLHSTLKTKDIQQVADEAIRFPDFQVAAAAITMETIDNYTAQAMIAYQKAAACWQSSSIEIKKLLAPKLFLAEIRRSLEAGLPEQLDEYMSQQQQPPSFTVPPMSDFLTQIKMSDLNGKTCLKSVIKEKKFPRHTFFEQWQYFIKLLAKVKETSRTKILIDLISFVRTELPQRTRMMQSRSFDDLLLSMDQTLTNENNGKLASFIRDRYPAALIDEFQDTDPVQYRIFKNIYANPDTTLFLIGDPKQAIYGFRGADIYTYLESAANNQPYTMQTNYRSDPAMVKALNSLFCPPLLNPFYEKRISFPEITPQGNRSNHWHGAGEEYAPLTFLCPPDALILQKLPDALLEKKIPALLAQDINHLLTSSASINNRAVTPGNIGVLVHTNKQAAAIKKALNKLLIPAVLQSNTTVYQSEEAGELLRLLTGVAQPNDERGLRPALTTILYGMSTLDLLALDSDEKSWLQTTSQFNNWQRLWQTKGFMRTARALSLELKFTEKLLPLIDGERRLTNIRHLLELIHEAEGRYHLKINGLITWFNRQYSKAAQKNIPAAADSELRLENDDDAVQIVTIHKSKGLEYPVVYCPYLWLDKVTSTKKRLSVTCHDPDDNWAGKIFLDDDDTARKQQQDETFSENIRLLYVALTRAKHCCMIFWVNGKNYHQSALAYLLHSPSFSFTPPSNTQTDAVEITTGRNHPQDVADNWFKQIKTCTPDQLFNVLKQRVSQSTNWTMRVLESKAGNQPFNQDKVTTKELNNRQLSHKIEASWRVSSFSNLTISKKTDHDYAARLSGDHNAFLSIIKTDPTTPIKLVKFPKGASAGNFFHKIFELNDFTETEYNKVETIIAQQLQGFGYAVKQWLSLVTDAFYDIVTTRLGTTLPLRLCDIPTKQRLNEFLFFFPVTEDNQETLRLDVTHLKNVFINHPHNIPPAYLAQVEALNFPPLAGYLKGFIDMVFQYHNKWYLVDYKSNYLGTDYENYNEENLKQAMTEHHYYLQYHIYTAALHRYLKFRLADYNYHKDFGGIFYLFIRGMSKKHGAKYGVFYDKPPIARIETLLNP